MRYLPFVAVLGLLACGGGGSSSSGSPIAPTPTVPQVGGNYFGTVTATYPELGLTGTCPASTVVTQSGRTVNIAPIVLSGQCGNLSVPLGQTTIDTTGAMAAESGTYQEAGCGTYTYTASGGFFGRDLRLSWNGTSTTCYNLNITIVLTR